MNTHLSRSLLQASGKWFYIMCRTRRMRRHAKMAEQIRGVFGEARKWRHVKRDDYFLTRRCLSQSLLARLRPFATENAPLTDPDCKQFRDWWTLPVSDTANLWSVGSHTMVCGSAIIHSINSSADTLSGMDTWVKNKVHTAIKLTLQNNGFLSKQETSHGSTYS